MATKALVIDAGTTRRVPDAETLIVGVGIDAATATTLTVGGTTANAITIGKPSITTSFPGPVELTGDVVTVGGTTFTTDATFEGNVTFGAGAADTVTFAPLTTVTSDINFGGAPGTYKITNLANGTAPNDAVNFSQLSAIVSGVSSFQTSLSGLTPSSATGGAITLAGTLGVTSGGTGTTTQFTQGSVVFAGASGVYTQDNANLFFNDGTNSLGIRTTSTNEALTVNGVLSLAEGTAPTNTAAFGKLWANSAADARPYWTDDTGQSFNLTLDRFNTLTPAASVAIDASPVLPVFNSLALNQNTTFTTTNLGNGRSASVRVVCDGTTRTLTFPGGWTWLGSGPPSSLAANDVGYLSITAYGATDADVVAAWSYENMPAVVTGSGTATRVAFWNGTSTLSSDANLYWDDTNNRLGVGTATPTTAIDLASGQLAIPDGTAAAPAIAFRDDLNTGIFSPSNDIVGVAVNGSEAVRIQESASTPVMLIGTSTVYGAITVDSNSADGRSGVVMLAHANASTVIEESYRGGQFAGVRSRGTKAAPTQIGAGDGMACVLGTGWTNTNGINYGAMMTMKAEQAFTSTASGGRIEFHTTTNGTNGATTLGSATTERLRIVNDGRVSIGQSGGAIVPAASGAILTLAGGITQSGGAVSLTANAASSLTTSSGNLTLTGGAALLLTAAAGNEVVVNDGSADVDFRVEGDTNTHALFVQGSDSHVGIGTSNVGTHLFNVGSGASSNFAVASGGRIHTYGGATPTDGQVLIGHTTNGRFEAATLTQGSGITITNGAGSITIAAVAGTDYSVVTLTTAQPANTAVTVGGAAAIATAAATSRVAGIVTATNTVKVLGICTCDVEGALSIAQGDVVYLSATEAGAVTNVAPSTATQVVAELGIATAASGGGTVAVLWQPKSIVVL